MDFEKEIQKNLISDADLNLLTDGERARYIGVLKRLEKINQEHELQLIEGQLREGAIDELSKQIGKLTSPRIMKTVNILKYVAITFVFCSVATMFLPMSCK